MAPPFSSIFVFSLLFIGVFVQASQQGDQSLPFSYEGSHGPEHWGSLNPKFAACSNGKSQSPIDVVKDKATHGKDLQALVKKYTVANATLVNNGLNIAVNFGGNAGGEAVIDGKTYRLKHLHWHSPSEHRLNGEQFAAELHLLHLTDDGSLSVIAILLQLGDPDPLLTKIHDNLVELANDKCAGNEEAHIEIKNLDTKHLRRKTRKYFRYTGSLTSPPCTENVVWNILGKVRTISQEQVELLKAPLDPVFKNNARPPQPLNGRKIEFYDEFSEY